jgi:hypothetical protein
MREPRLCPVPQSSPARVRWPALAGFACARCVADRIRAAVAHDSVIGRSFAMSKLLILFLIGRAQNAGAAAVDWNGVFRRFPKAKP